MGFFKNLFARGREPSDAELNAIFVPLRDRVCDFKDETGISWAAILPEIQNVALKLMLKHGGVEAARKVFSAKSIVQHLPNNIPVGSIDMRFSNQISPQEKESVSALASSIAYKMIGEGYPVAHVAQALSTFVVMTAVSVGSPFFAAAILTQSFNEMKNSSEANAEQQVEKQTAAFDSWDITAPDGPWHIVEDQVVRTFAFKHLFGPELATLFQIRVKVELNSFGSLNHFVIFVINRKFVFDGPPIGRFETLDEKVSSGFFTVKVGIIEDKYDLFIVDGEAHVYKCLEALSSGKPLKFMLLNRNEYLVRFILKNDSGFHGMLQKVRKKVSQLC